jgi:hypothetical protein
MYFVLVLKLALCWCVLYIRFFSFHTFCTTSKVGPVQVSVLCILDSVNFVYFVLVTKLALCW